MMKRLFLWSAVCVALGLAGCGGGGGSSSSPSVHPITPPSSAPASGPVAPASFAIKIPGSATSGVSRRTKTVNAATQSLVFTLLKTDNPTPPALPNVSTAFNVAVGSPLCTAPDSNGARNCTIGIAAPIGNDIYTVDTYSSTNGTGTKLGSGAVNIRVLQNVANTASITLGGQIATVLITTANNNNAFFFEIGPPNNVDNAPTSRRIYVIAFDAQGNVILTPDTFSVPVSLSLEVPAFCECNPLSTTVPLVQLTVAYANPGAGPATAQITNATALPIVQVTSPNDVVTMNALSPGSPNFGEIELIATVGAITSLPPPNVPSNQQLEVDVSAASPPTTALSWFLQTGAFQSQFTPAFSTVPAAYSFSSPQDVPATLGVTDFVAGLPHVGTVNFTTTCPSDRFTTPTFPLSSPLDIDGRTEFILLLATNFKGTTQSLTCTITATDDLNVSAPITINVISATGVIQ